MHVPRFSSLRRYAFAHAPLPIAQRHSRSHHGRFKCTATPLHLTPSPHTPVLLEEILSYFPAPRVFIDCTLGAGGHAEALLSTRQIERYIGIDKDAAALRIARDRLQRFLQVEYIQGDFRDLCKVVPSLVVPPDGILLDVGVSSMQLDNAYRGFSFMRDGPLDMRMGNEGISAYDIVNGSSEEVLRHILWEYGEERQAGKIARAICREREKGMIKGTKELASIVERVKGWRKKGIHPATLTFQAVRIAVNGELDALEEGLRSAVEMCADGGRVAVVCFHSLEDRIAKGVFRELKESGKVGLVTKKAVFGEEGEVGGNVRARSARLRVVQKLREGEDWGKKNKYRTETNVSTERT